VELLATPIQLALTSIAAHKIRAALTALGMVVGVGAVVMTMSLSDGATAKLGEQIANSTGKFNVMSRGGSLGSRMGFTPGLRDEHVRRIARGAIHVGAVEPVVSQRLAIGTGPRSATFAVLGVTAHYFDQQRITCARGSAWSEEEEASNAKLAVLGWGAAKRLFGEADPIGQTVTIGGTTVRIVGVAAPQADDIDGTVYLPLVTVRSRILAMRGDRLDSLSITPKSRAEGQLARAEVREMLEHDTKPGMPSAYMLIGEEERLRKRVETLEDLARLCVTAAALSLLVGGIGIANIMLVSVRERIREIGIRLAIGASAVDVLLQFLVEAMLLSAVGGVVGIGVGLIGTKALAASFDWPLQISVMPMILGVGVSTIVGLVFGFVPALRASRLNPIDALRT
jgi:putative ABC transport system permease protein